MSYSVCKFLGRGFGLCQGFAALNCSEAFQVSAMLYAAMHLVEDGLLRFSDDPLDMELKGCKRSWRATPLAAFHAAIAACLTTISLSVGRDDLSPKSIALRQSALLTPKSVLATVFNSLCVATSSPVWGCCGFRWLVLLPMHCTGLFR